MYTNTGYLTSADADIVDYEQPLLVSSCGIYRLLQRKAMITSRPHGRNDYQLLYVASGKATFYYETASGPRSRTAPAGSLMLYRPGEMQYYKYFLEDTPEVCWVHFTGKEAGQLLDKIGFQDTPLLCCDLPNDFTELFRLMIQELQLKRPCFDELLSLYLRQLFCRIKRSQQETSADNYRPSPEIESAIHYFNESFSQDISIEEYAAERHVSVSGFIRSFKRYTGTTPLKYITLLRINKAKELLQATNYSVQEIGKIVGYEDQLYFSRIFKKQTGKAPTWFRRE